MTPVVLDASAILALLKGERGGSKVASVIADASVCAINQAEVISHFVQLGAPIDEVRAMLGALPYTVVAADDILAWRGRPVACTQRPWRPGCRWATASAWHLPSASVLRPIQRTRRGRMSPATPVLRS